MPRGFWPTAAFGAPSRVRLNELLYCAEQGCACLQGPVLNLYMCFLPHMDVFVYRSLGCMLYGLFTRAIVRHLNVSILKSMCCTYTCAFVPHLDVFDYKSLCCTRTCLPTRAFCYPGTFLTRSPHGVVWSTKDFSVFRFCSTWACLFRLFRYRLETPKQTKTIRNKPKIYFLVS